MLHIIVHRYRSTLLQWSLSFLPSARVNNWSFRIGSLPVMIRNTMIMSPRCLLKNIIVIFRYCNIYSYGCSLNKESNLIARLNALVIWSFLHRTLVPTHSYHTQEYDVQYVEINEFFVNRYLTDWFWVNKLGSAWTPSHVTCSYYQTVSGRLTVW